MISEAEYLGVAGWVVSMPGNSPWCSLVLLGIPSNLPRLKTGLLGMSRNSHTLRFELFAKSSVG